MAGPVLPKTTRPGTVDINPEEKKNVDAYRAIAAVRYFSSLIGKKMAEVGVKGLTILRTLKGDQVLPNDVYAAENRLGTMIRPRTTLGDCHDQK